MRSIKSKPVSYTHLAQGKKLERLERELAEANERLAQRQQIVATSGTMAEAAMRLNRVFEAADSAAKEYLSNMELIANSLLDDARRKAARIIKDEMCIRDRL